MTYHFILQHTGKVSAGKSFSHSQLRQRIIELGLILIFKLRELGGQLISGLDIASIPAIISSSQLLR